MAKNTDNFSVFRYMYSFTFPFFGKTFGTYATILVLGLLFCACSASKQSKKRLDKAVEKIKKRNLKRGRIVEVHDVYAKTGPAAAQTTRPKSERGFWRKDKKPALDSRVNRVVSEAKSYFGTPHRLGGMSKRGIDCSGLILLSFKKANINMPRTSSRQAMEGKSVKVKDLRKGDLVFFSISRQKINHVGVVSRVEAGEVWFIHASTSKGVREDRLSSAYWKRNFVRARRVL